MSADNGFYILHCTDGFRVAHCQAIENIYYNCRRQSDPKFNERELYKYFAQSPVFQLPDTALVYARGLQAEIGWSEYGICWIGSGDFKFPKKLPPCCEDGTTQDRAKEENV